MMTTFRVPITQKTRVVGQIAQQMVVSMIAQILKMTPMERKMRLIYALDLRTFFGDNEHPMVGCGQLDGASSPSGSDASVVVDNPSPVQKKSKKTT